jgi:hypothetical protein
MTIGLVATQIARKFFGKLAILPITKSHKQAPHILAMDNSHQKKNTSTADFVHCKSSKTLILTKNFKHPRFFPL